MPPMTTQKKPFNKGKIMGRKPPLTPDQVSVIRSILGSKGNLRDIALFAVAIDSSLRGSDLVALNVSDVLSGGEVLERVTLEQSKTQSRVSFTMRDATRAALKKWIDAADKAYGDPLFTSLKGNRGERLKVDTYRRLVKDWVSYAHLDPARYGSHSLRRTRVAHIYKKTANLRAVQVLLGHKNIETTTRYLGIEEEQALDIAKQFEI